MAGKVPTSLEGQTLNAAGTPLTEFGSCEVLHLHCGNIASNAVPWHHFSLVPAGVQPRLIQGIRRRDGIGEGQETTA